MYLDDAFRSERLVYRAVEPGDLDFLHREMQDPANLALWDSRLLRPRTRKDTETLISMMEKSLLGVIICIPAQPPDPEPETPAASNNASAATPGPEPPTPIGLLTLGIPGSPDAYAPHRRVVLGITLANAYCNRGYGTEALRWALAWAFDKGGLHRVSLQVGEFNPRAQRLYEKVGFQYEGRQRQACWMDGRFWDVLGYGILEEEWRAMQTGKGDETTLESKAIMED